MAVVETEEAAAIAGEQAEGVERTVPLFVKGSFIVVNAVTKKDVTFTVEVVLTRGPRTLATVRREKVPLREVARFLRREVAPRVLKEAGKQAGQPLAEAEQVKELVARADVFTRVGDWSHAAGLREAALLLDPDSVEQRVQLLHEYDRIASQEIYEVGLKPVTAESIGSIDWGSPALVRAVRRRADAASARLAHVEYLVRNKLLDAHRAMDLIVGMRLWTIIGHVPRLHACELGPTGLRAKALGPAATAGETFALKIVPLVLGLPRGKKKARFEESLLTRWSESMMRRLRYRLDLGYARKEDLDHMAWLYGELLPQKLSSQMLVRLPPVDGPSLKSAKTVSYGGSVFSMDDWRSFLRKLERSKSDVVRAFGRFCEIRWEWTIHQHIKAKSVSELKGLLKQADALQAELGRLGFRFRGYPLAETVSYVPNRVHFMRRDLCLALKLHPPIRPGGDPVATAGTLPSREKGTGRLLFERLDVQLRTQDGKRVPFEQNRLRMSPAGDRQATLLRCTNKLDVLWDETFILIMRTKGLFEELPHTGEPSFTDVKWDGESIWVGTRRQGVWVLAPSGKVKAKITAKQGLPPCDVKVLLHPIGKDRALAVGSFGGQRRGWCAVIEKKGDTYSVKVFLRATEAAIGDRIANPVVDLKRAFEPAWLHELDTGDKNQRILLVGRRASRRQVMYPLRIDLHTLNVSHLPIRMKTGVFSRAFYSENGRLFESRNWHVAYWTGRDCHWKDEREEEVRFICRSPGKYSRYQLVPYNGRVYVPNDVWFRFDPATLKVERLVPGRLPEKYIMWYTAVSGHYGLVTWGGNHALHRITLKETDRDEEDPN